MVFYLLKLDRLPERIEAFDISNIGGKEAVASMVVFENGQPNKNEYRKFKIRPAESRGAGILPKAKFAGNILSAPQENIPLLLGLLWILGYKLQFSS